MKFEELVKKFKVKRLPNSEATIEGEVPADVIAPYREKALEHIAEHVDMDGFRKGNVPKDMVLKNVGEIAVLEEAVEMFARDFYPELIELQKLDAVGAPDIRIMKLAPGNPVSLVITTALYPDVNIPKNWKALASKVPAETAEEVEEKEIETTLESLRKSREKDGVLPELTDDFARSIGVFSDLADLKEKIRTGIGEEKVRRAKDKRRGNIIETILAKTEVEIPNVFVESELGKIMANLEEDVKRIGLTVEEYLKRLGKTMEELRNEFREQAGARAKLQLVLNKLAADEKIEAEEQAVEAEMKHAKEHFPDAKENLLRIHIETVLRNEKTLQMLETTGA